MTLIIICSESISSFSSFLPMASIFLSAFFLTYQPLASAPAAVPRMAPPPLSAMKSAASFAVMPISDMYCAARANSAAKFRSMVFNRFRFFVIQYSFCCYAKVFVGYLLGCLFLWRCLIFIYRVGDGRVVFLCMRHI